MTTAGPALDAHAAAYDLVARLYLQGPAALAADRLPPPAPLLEALGRLEPTWPRKVDALLGAVGRPGRLAQLEEAYDATVLLPLPGRHVPPYASVHLGEHGLWGRSTLEVEAAYAEAGFSWSAGTARARPLAPDHLGLELAFLAVTEAEATAHPIGGQSSRLRRFLDHLLRWLPRYRDALRTAGAEAFLVSWTGWILAVARHDLDRLADTPRDHRVRTAGRPGRRPLSERRSTTDTPRDTLTRGLAERLDIPPLSPAEIDAVLSLAGAAAHGTGDRTSAPLVCFLAGLNASTAGARPAAITDVHRQVAEIAPSPARGD